jgi:hypothetical protein
LNKITTREIANRPFVIRACIIIRDLSPPLWVGSDKKSPQLPPPRGGA